MGQSTQIIEVFISGFLQGLAGFQDLLIALQVLEIDAELLQYTGVVIKADIGIAERPALPFAIALIVGAQVGDDVGIIIAFSLNEIIHRDIHLIFHIDVSGSVVTGRVEDIRPVGLCAGLEGDQDVTIAPAVIQINDVITL